MGRTFVMGRCLGKGGFGEVYAVTIDEGAGPRVPVAVKLLHEELGGNHQAVQRMHDEARLLARVSHPSILQVYGLTRLAGRVALITEYVEGADLSTCIEEGGIAPRALLMVASAVARALHAAYTSNPEGRGPLQLVHRDIKPSNIRLSRDGGVKLLDFGIARSDAITRAAHTASDLVVGSPPYLAPERFRKGAPRPASDIYALGATLFEGLTGRRFMNLTLTVQAAHSLDADMWNPFMDARLQGLATLPVAEAMVPLLRRALAHDPEARPPAESFAAACDALGQKLHPPDLVTWARGRTWSEARRSSGTLAGQVLEEDQLQFRTTEVRPTRAVPSATPTYPLPKPVPPQQRGRSPGFVVLALAFGLTGFGAMALMVVFVVAGLSGNPRPRRLLTPTKPPPVVTAPSSPPASGPAIEVGPRTDPILPAAPDVVPPKPEVAALGPTETVAPAPPQSRLRRVGEQPIWAVRTDVPGPRVDLAASFIEVPPGTYTVWAIFDRSGPVRAISELSVRPDYAYTIRCDANMETCSLQ